MYRAALRDEDKKKNELVSAKRELEEAFSEYARATE
jgi:hypothetical protein